MTGFKSHALHYDVLVIGGGGAALRAAIAARETGADGRMVFQHTPGHTYTRHVRGENRTGSDLILPIKEFAKRIGVRFLDRVFITALIPQGERPSHRSLREKSREKGFGWRRLTRYISLRWC